MFKEKNTGPSPNVKEVEEEERYTAKRARARDGFFTRQYVLS